MTRQHQLGSPIPVRTPDDFGADPPPLRRVDPDPLRQQADEMEQLLRDQPRMHTPEETQRIRERIAHLRDQATRKGQS